MQQINISVEYYSNDHKTLFQCFPNVSNLNNVIIKGVTISEGEFLAYMMFSEQMDRDGFRTFSELQSKIQHRLGDIDDFLSFNNGSVQAKLIGKEMMQSGFTERIGVALGLCVINSIHELTTADWKKIPEAPGRKGHSTFDFEIPIASTGTNFVQVENKGSIVENNTIQGVSVQNHYNGILKKKNYTRQREIESQITSHQNLYYGTIGVLDNRNNSKARVWLVDPPAFEIEMDPQKYKLLARLRYYLDEFKSIGMKASLIKALDERIKRIAETDNYMQFDNIPLDDKFSPTKNSYQYMQDKTFTTIDTNEGFGRVFVTEFKQAFYPYLVAFSRSIMKLIVKQDFTAILSYNYAPDFMKEKVQVLMRFSKSDMLQYKLSERLKFGFNERKSSFESVYFGKVNYSSDGRIFGLLDSEI